MNSHPFHPHNNLVRGIYCSYLMCVVVEVEAQRGKVTYLKLHSLLVVELELKPRKAGCALTTMPS